MSQNSRQNPDLAADFLLALRPVSRHLRAHRTLSEGKVGILRHLTEHGPSTASELAAAIHVSNQGISLGVRDLEALNQVQRTTDATDRRRVWITITDAGHEALAQEAKVAQGILNTAIERSLTDADRAALADVVPVLKKLAKSMLDD